MTPEFDAIVIGSGITGGWAAKELTERGLTVLMIERGRPIEHQSGYTNEWTPPWEMPFRGFGDQEALRIHKPVQQASGLVDEWTMDHFVNDDEHPYESPAGAPFTWVRGYQLGGKSLIWGRQCYRWSQDDFQANAKDGHGIPWPIGYADLARYYDKAESFIGVSGSVDGLPQLPDGIFQPPMALNAAEKMLAQRLAGRFPDRKLIPSRSANLTEAKPGRSKCQNRGICARGCSFGAYFSTQSSTLPAARSTGRLTLATDIIVESIEYDEATGKAVAVRTIDAITRQTGRRTARMFFVNASTINSVALLLRSRSDRWPNGLGNSSGLLGAYFMDHAMTIAGSSTVPEVSDRTYYGNRPTGYVIPRFRNVGEDRRDFLRGYMVQGVGYRGGWRRGAAPGMVGRQLHEELIKPGPWHLVMAAFMETLPNVDNRITLTDKKDRWGLPQISVRLQYGANENKMLADVNAEARSMLGTLNGDLHMAGTMLPPGSSIHEMGGACMGEDPRRSVVNALNQLHDVRNIFVTDGAAMASNACQNPSLTYMAMTIRAAENAVSMAKADRI